MLLAVLPVAVVATGTTVALQLLPYAGSPADGARSTLPGSVAVSTGSPSAGRSVAASAAQGAASVPPSGGASATPGGVGAVGGTAAGGTAAGGGGAAGSSGSAGSGGASGSGSSGGGAPGAGSGAAGSTGGSSAGSTPGSTTGSTAGSASGSTTGSASGSTTGSGTGTGSAAAGYRNASTGSCLTQVFGAAGLGACGSSAASWTVRAAPGGAYQLVNASGRCLSANLLGQATFVGSCDGAGPRLWRSGSGSTLVSVYNGGCLQAGYADVSTPSCASGSAVQRWSRV